MCRCQSVFQMRRHTECACYIQLTGEIRMRPGALMTSRAELRAVDELAPKLDGARLAAADAWILNLEFA